MESSEVEVSEAVDEPGKNPISEEQESHAPNEDSPVIVQEINDHTNDESNDSVIVTEIKREESELPPRRNLNNLNRNIIDSRCSSLPEINRIINRSRSVANSTISLTRIKKKQAKNPFIAFFLSMYSRRPKKRAADVARQAGRQWRRMSDRQRRKYEAMVLPKSKKFNYDSDEH